MFVNYSDNKLNDTTLPFATSMFSYNLSCNLNLCSLNFCYDFLTTIYYYYIILLYTVQGNIVKQ